jgi:hypothetical protein
VPGALPALRSIAKGPRFSVCVGTIGTPSFQSKSDSSADDRNAN